jgi:hypothetical protein
MSKKNAVLLVIAVTLGFCPRCAAQTNGSADASGNSYAPSDSYRLPRADSGLRGPVDNANTTYSGNGLPGSADNGSGNASYPNSGLRGPSDNGFNNNAGAQYGTQNGAQYGTQYGSQNATPYGTQYGAPPPAGSAADGLSGGSPAPFSGAKVKGNNSAAGAVVGVPDRAAKSAIGATDKAAKTSVGVTGKAVKEIFKAITP